MVQALDPALFGVLVAVVAALVGIARYGYGLPVLVGSLVVPPAVGLGLGVAYLLQSYLGLALHQTLALVGGAMVGSTLAYLAVPYARRLGGALHSGAATGLSLLLTVLVPWRLAHWLRTRRP